MLLEILLFRVYYISPTEEMAVQEEETIGPNTRNAGECQVLGYGAHQRENQRLD